MTPVEGGPGRKRFFDAEKFGILFIVGIVAVVAIAGLAFAVAGSVAGLVVIVVLVAGALTVAFRFDRRGPVEVRSSVDEVQRLLVVANEGLGGARLRDALGKRAAGTTHVHVVVPALADPADRASGDEAPRAAAEADLARLTVELRNSFASVEGSVGDPDPRIALEDALRSFPADEVILVNPPAGSQGRLEHGAVERAREDVPLRVTELEVD